MKKWFVVSILIFVFVILGLTWMKWDDPERRRQQLNERMLSADTYQQAAIILAQHCKSVEQRIPLYGGAYLPEEMQAFSPHGYISPDGANLEIGGREDYFGYSLRKEIIDGTEYWVLYYYAYVSDEQKLHAVRVEDIEPVSKKSIVIRLEDYFDKKIKLYPGVSYWCEYKIMCLIAFSEYEKAIIACDDALNIFEDEVWFVMTRAFLRSAAAKQDAANAFQAWVKANPSYTNYFDLFHFAQTLNDKALALHAIEAAIEQPLMPSSRAGGNVYFYAFLMARYAYEQADVELAIKVCDAMTDPSREKERKTSESYFHFASLRRALEKNQKELVEYIFNNPAEYNPYESHVVPWNK